MRNIFDFIRRYSTWFVFAFYVLISCIMLFRNNPYQHHVFLTSASTLSSSLYRVSHNVTSYFNLRDINDDLLDRNASLESEVIALRRQVREYRALTDTTIVAGMHQFEFVNAPVINNSISRPKNFITIAKGTADGIKPEMGVVGSNGVVGVVNVVGEHNSRVISLLNPDIHLSCKIRSSDFFGSLVWDGVSSDEALLEELPKHGKYNVGDTIVTSGYSAIFPEGVPVGYVKGIERDHDANFATLRVRLVTDFATLSTVRVISNKELEAIREVEQDAGAEDNENMGK